MENDDKKKIFLSKNQQLYFKILLIFLIVFSIPYPMTCSASLMSAAGYASKENSKIFIMFVRLFWIAMSLYPFIFFTLFFIGKKMVINKIYIGYVVSLLPILFITSFIAYILV